MGSFSAPSSGPSESRRLAVESTVRWLPLADPYYLLASVLVTARSAPLVVEQRALLEVEANCRAAEPKPYGVLLGGHYFCPRGRFEYLLVQQVIGLMPEPEELDPMAAMAAQLSAAIRDAEHRGHRVVGWYRDGAEILPRVGSREARLHRMLCPEPWHVALLRNAGGASPAGAFVRLEPTEIRPYSIPFHELLPEGKQRGGQKRRTCIRWSNYRSDGEVELLPESELLGDGRRSSWRERKPIQIAPAAKRATPATPTPTRSIFGALTARIRRPSEEPRPRFPAPRSAPPAPSVDAPTPSPAPVAAPTVPTTPSIAPVAPAPALPSSPAPAPAARPAAAAVAPLPMLGAPPATVTLSSPSALVVAPTPAPAPPVLQPPLAPPELELPVAPPSTNGAAHSTPVAVEPAAPAPVENAAPVLEEPPASRAAEAPAPATPTTAPAPNRPVTPPQQLERLMAHAVAESRAARRRERRLRSRFAVIGFGLVLAITGLVVDRWLSPNALPGSASAEATIRQDSAPGTIASRPASAPAPARPSRASTPNDVERYSTLLAKDLDAYDASVAAARDPATRQRSCARADSIYLSVLIDLQMLDLAFRQAGPMVDANAFQRADQLTRRGYLITPALEVPACRQ